jgi:DNA polymerase III subunit delta'
LSTDVEVDPFAEVVGQAEAVAQLTASALHPVHAYMFVGPRGSGRWAAARGFASLVLSEGLSGESADRARRLALRGEHPDLVRIDPTGNQYRDEEVREIIIEASRTPVEGARKVIVAGRFHTANATAIGRLLKTLEEPPESTVIVLLSEEVPDEQITIASRCLTVPFRAVAHEAVVEWLASRGVDSESADLVALASGGDLLRAADLMGDSDVATRHSAWRSIPDRLDGTGAAVAIAVDELRELIDQAQGPIDGRHARELEDLAFREESLGTRGSGRRDLEAAQKREVRRLRLDELRFGLATLAGIYRDRVVTSPSRPPLAAIEAIRDANLALMRNPNEALLLQALFLTLSPGRS